MRVGMINGGVDGLQEGSNSWECSAQEIKLVEEPIDVGCIGSMKLCLRDLG